MIGFIKNTRGFSLIETMIALAIMGVLALNMSSIMTPALNLAVYTEDLSTATQEVEVLRIFLRKDDICTKMLEASDVIGKTVTESTTPIVLGDFSVGSVTKRPTGRLKLDSVKLGTFSLLTAPAESPKRYLASLQLNYAHKSRTLAPREVLLQIETDASDKVIACNSDLEKSQQQTAVPNFYDSAACTNADGSKDIWNVSRETSDSVSYNCFRGGEKTTRSSIIYVSKNSGKITGGVYRAGGCQTKNCIFKIDSTESTQPYTGIGANESGTNDYQQVGNVPPEYKALLEGLDFSNISFSF